MTDSKKNFRVQQLVVVVAVLLFGLKVAAYLITRSVAILTDTLESTVNVIAGFIGLYSLYVASKPSDWDHPYGHGKAEFVSAAVEGTLITIAGLAIIYESIYNFIYPNPIHQLDAGIYLVALTAAINFGVGHFCVIRGKKNNSMALIASGKHLQTDTYTTLGIIAGLILIYFTNKSWLDSAVAILFSIIIIVTGYRIIRSSLAGIMDEADKKLLDEMIARLNKNRQANWIDLHNLRIIKYGGQLHVDCHLTVPWYMNVNEAHIEVDELSKLIRQEFGFAIELFVHSDGCLYSQCNICNKEDCPVRKKPFERRIEWTMENIISNKKHELRKEETGDMRLEAGD